MFMTLGAPQANNKYVRQELIPEFKKETGIDVELRTSDWGSGFQKITTAAASNSLPDVFMMGAIWLAPLASKNVLQPLDSRFDKWADKDQLPESVLKDAKYKGKLYAIPFGADFKGPVYRKDILEQAGVTELPTTWDEWREAARKVKALNKVKSPIWWNTDKSIGNQQAYAVLMMQNDAKYWNDKGEPQFAAPKSIAALKFMADTYKEGLANVNLVYSGNGPRPLTAGEAAMSFGGSAEISSAALEKKDVLDKLAVGPGLKGPDGKPAVGLWSNKFGIAKTSKNKDAAWKFLTFLMKKKNLSEFARTGGVLPSRKDLRDASWLKPSDKEFLKLLDIASGQPSSPIMMQLGKMVNSMLEPLDRGNKSPEQTGKDIDAALSKLLKK